MIIETSSVGRKTESQRLRKQDTLHQKGSVIAQGKKVPQISDLDCDITGLTSSNFLLSEKKTLSGI